MQCSVIELTFSFSLAIWLVCTQRFPLNYVAHSIHHFLFVPFLLLFRVIWIKMTSSVANNFFSCSSASYFLPQRSWNWRPYIFWMFASTCISDPEAGSKGGALDSHVMILSKPSLIHSAPRINFFLHRTVSLSWNYRSPEIFSPVKRSAYSLCYQPTLLLKTLYFSITDCASVACDFRIKRGVLPYTIYHLFL